MKKIRLCLLVLSLLCFVSCLSLPFGEKKEEEIQENLTIQQLILAGRGDEAREMFQLKTDINGTDEEGNTALHSAAQMNDVELVKFLLYMGANSELKNMNGDTPLHLAIKNDALNCVEVLASIESNIFAKDGTGISAFELILNKDEKFLNAIINPQIGSVKDGQGQTIIHYLVKLKNAKAIKKCIEKGIPVSVEDDFGISPLQICYLNSDSVESVRIAADLILADAIPIRSDFSFFEDSVITRNPSMRFDDGQTPLHLATIQGKTGVVEYLIEKGASIKAKDVSGATPLHEAVRYGRYEIAMALLKAGADVNAQDSLGKTPLLIISPAESREKIYSLLLKYQANPNSKDMYGDTPLHIATITGMKLPILENLVKAGADINERNKKGVTPLALAVEHQWNDQIDYYAKLGADVHAEDIDGNTPLSRALSSNLDVTKKLINKKNSSIRDSFGNTPLHIAITSNAKMEQIKYLVEVGSDIDARNRNGDSPLFLAVQNNMRSVGELLLAHSADVFATNTENYSPLRMAMIAGGEVQDWILSSEVIKAVDGIGNTPLHYAAEWKLNSSVAVLLEKGANPNTQNSNGETALFSAVKADSPSTLELLIKNGANQDSRDYLGNTALHTCVRYDAKNAATVLIYGGADIDAQNMSGKTPLHEAARAGRTAMVSLLLTNGANINATDTTGKTVLIDSIQSGNTDLVKLLLNNGASPLIQEMYGRNAYHEVAEKGEIELINLIREAGGNPLSRDTHGRTPFSLVLNRSEEMIKAVLGNDKNLSDSDGNTPIHIAVSNRVSPFTIEMLIGLGYPVNRRNSTGLTPLSLAVLNEQIDIAKKLLEAGADPYITNNQGDCALSIAMEKSADMLNFIVQYAGNKKDMAGDGILHYAARIANEDTIKKLVHMGLDKNQRNISGETAFDIAKRWQRGTEIEELLR